MITATEYVGWVTPTSLRLNITSPLLAPAVRASFVRMTVTAVGFQDSTLTSPPSNSVLNCNTDPAALTDNWPVFPPRVVNVTAMNPWNDLWYGAGDMIQLRFDQNTSHGVDNRVYTKAELDSLLRPTAVLGANYTGFWATPAILRVLIVDATGFTVSSGTALFNLDASFGFTSAPAGSVYNSSGLTPVTTGSWIATAIAAPTVVSVIAWNPVNGSTHTGAQVVIRFSAPTVGGVTARQYNTVAEVDDMLQPSHSLGTLYTAGWTTSTTLVINIVNGTGATADSGILSFNLSSSNMSPAALLDLRVSTNNSMPATGVTPLATGTFYFVSGNQV